MKARIFDPETRKWWTLAAVAFGLFMIMLDNTVVNVALPAIQEDLGADLSALEWIVTGYALTFAAVMLTGGKLADLLGRRLIFVVGLAIFTVSQKGEHANKVKSRKSINLLLRTRVQFYRKQSNARHHPPTLLKEFEGRRVAGRVHAVARRVALRSRRPQITVLITESLLRL